MGDGDSSSSRAPLVKLRTVSTKNQESIVPSPTPSLPFLLFRLCSATRPHQLFPSPPLQTKDEIIQLMQQSIYPLSVTPFEMN